MHWCWDALNITLKQRGIEADHVRQLATAIDQNLGRARADDAHLLSDYREALSAIFDRSAA